MHFASVCRRSMFIVVLRNFCGGRRNVAYGSLDICLLTVTELPIVYQELAKHGIAVEVGIVERNGALGKMQSLYVRDPDNNLVEISRYE